MSLFHTSSSWRNLDDNESGELICVKLFKEKREELYILSMSLFLSCHFFNFYIALAYAALPYESTKADDPVNAW